MNVLVQNVHPKNVWSYHPGRVGSIGDVNPKPRFRQSSPDMVWAYDPYWAGKRANKLGSNVQDGDTIGYDNKGGPANTFDEKWVGNRSLKHQYGYSIHDVQSPDKRTEPIVSSLGDFSWRRKIATVRNVKRTGRNFLPLPQGYSSDGNSIPRGTQPISETLGGNPSFPPNETDIITGGNNVVAQSSPLITPVYKNPYSNITSEGRRVV